MIHTYIYIYIYIYRDYRYNIYIYIYIYICAKTFLRMKKDPEDEEETPGDLDHIADEVGGFYRLWMAF